MRRSLPTCPFPVVAALVIALCVPPAGAADLAASPVPAGHGISAGVVRGRAKVLTSPYQKPLENGEILITRATEPAWTPIFMNAAGVVLEVGGPLQHGAIIAREYGLPCVTGIPDATALIENGDEVTVDGYLGIVTIGSADL